jgi:hypothetical protein
LALLAQQHGQLGWQATHQHIDHPRRSIFRVPQRVFRFSQPSPKLSVLLLQPFHRHLSPCLSGCLRSRLLIEFPLEQMRDETVDRDAPAP